MKKAWATFVVLVGVGTLGITIWLIVAGVRDPTPGRTIAVAILSAVGVPIALAIMSVGYKQFRGPNFGTLKTEAEAKLRTARALEDAETAETIRAQLDAYVEIRSWHLEIERRREELANTGKSLVQMRRELNDMEARLNVRLTQIDDVTIDTLGEILEEHPRFDTDIFVVDFILNTISNYMERRRIRRMASLVPEAVQNQSVANGDESKVPRGES